MKNIFSKKKASVPGFLVPKVRKRHVSMLYTNYETEWKVFAEGSLRNKVFHDDVLNRGDKCLVCDNSLGTVNPKKSSHIEKHHHCYLRLCTGKILSKNSGDIYRKARKMNFPSCPIAASARLIIQNIILVASKKSFPSTGNATAEFIR